MLSIMERADLRQISPAGVRVTPPRPLWNTAVPISFSKVRIWRDKAGCATFSRRDALTKVFSSATATNDFSCLRSIWYSIEVWEGYQTGIGLVDNVTVTLRSCSTVPLFQHNELTAIENEPLPWITGEFDITAIMRGAPRILNRAQFVDHVDRQLQITRKSIDPRFAVLFVDLECYGSVVTMGGKQAADALVRASAEKIGMKLAPRDAVAILTGGTIGVLLESAYRRVSPQEFALSLQSELRSVTADGVPVTETTVSVGIAKVSGNYIVAEEILRDAGIAMHSAEADGTGQIVAFNRAMDLTYAESAIAT
jgi:diguanylate cyclase (GGDEF)-like protein